MPNRSARRLATRFAVVAVTSLAVPHLFAAEPESGGYFLGEFNPITEIYVGDKAPPDKAPPDKASEHAGRTEVVFELDSMHFYSGAHDYGCIFVNGRIVWIKEYNADDSYVRGFVELPEEDEEMVAYSGVVSRRGGNIDPFNHKQLWQTFIDSQREPFRGKVKDRPRWVVTNPIRLKRMAEAKQRELKDASEDKDGPIENLQGRGYPYLQMEEIPRAVAMVKHPHTGQTDRFYAIWGLAISGYTPQGAEVLFEIAADQEALASWREYAAMGLGNFSSTMPPRKRDQYLAALRKTLAAEREKTPSGLLRLMISWNDVTRVEQALGKAIENHPMRVEILIASPRPEASDELW